MGKKFLAVFLFCCLLSSSIFALSDVDNRALDAVLGIESYMKWLREFDGEEYEEYIEPSSYALIGKKEAFEAYKAQAERGDVQAMCAVAECYDYGVIGNPDLEKAFDWWSRAAEKNYAPALNALGTFYSPDSYHARLFGTDEEKAKTLFEQSAAAGYGKAFANLDRFEEAISAGYTDAYVYWAAFLIEKGDSESIEKGISLYTTAANEYSSSYAMYALMKLYSEGENANGERAKYWARRYSDQHYKEIQFERAKNAILLPYIKKRADVGDVNSMFELSGLYGTNYLDAVNPSYRALHVYYLKKAAEGGSKKAMRALAHAYEMGDGVECDKKKAVDLYEASLTADDILSEMSLRAIYIESLPAEVWSYVTFLSEEKDSWGAATYSPSYSDSYEGITSERAFNYLLSRAEENEDCRAAASYCLKFGIGCDMDEEKAAELGYVDVAQENITSETTYQAKRAEFNQLKKEEESRLVKNANTEKTAAAYYELFDFYDGFYNTLDTEAKCFELLKKASVFHHASALRELSHYYQDGKSCASDPNQAAKLLQMAAGLGDVIAQEELAQCFLQGFGVEYNFDEAIAWLLRAASGENVTAKSILRRFGYSDVIDVDFHESESENAAESSIEDAFEYDDGLDEDYDEQDFGALWGDVDGGDENAKTESEVSLLGEPVVISLKNHASFSVASHSSVEECALTFWASLLGGGSSMWKDCLAVSADDELLFSGEAFEERLRSLDAIFSLARSLGALDGIEIRFYFSAKEEKESGLVSVPSALYANSEFQSASAVEFVKGDDDLWYLKM